MTRSCFIKSCKKSDYDRPGVTFHRLPARLLDKWLDNIGRDNITVSKYTLVCSRHFEEQFFDRTGQTTRLRDNAYPTLNLPTLQPKTETTDDAYRPLGTQPTKELKTIIKRDHSYAELRNHSEYKKLYTIAKHKLTRAKMEIKRLQQDLRRRRERTENVNKILKEVKRKAYARISEILKTAEGEELMKGTEPKKVLIVI